MSWPLPSLDDLQAAAAVVYRHMPPTPQYNWPLVDRAAGTQVWVKHENHTPVGAFKIRGGLCYMDALKRHDPSVRGVVGATRGNHGQSMGFAARISGIPATVFVPEGNSPEKNAAMRALGVELIVGGKDFQDACEHAKAYAEQQDLHMLPSLAPELVAGVGTYALEFLRGAPPLDVVYVPIGLGSGICGMMAARDALGLRTKIVGVVSSGAPAYKLSFEAGRKIEHEVTTVLADGLACRTPSDHTLRHLATGCERVIEVDEAEVANAMRTLFTATHNVAEGAGAASFAALLQERDRMAGKRVGVILCGGNVDADMFARVLAS